MPYSWNKTYTFQQNFHTHQKWVSSIKPTHQILIIPILTTFKSKFLQQCHKLHTLLNFMSHQHCPSFIMPNNSTIQKCPKAKITTQEFPTKSYNVQNFNKKKQRQNDNVSTPSSQQNMKPTNLPTKKWKNELTLKSILECGAWVLGSWRRPSSLSHSRDGWYFVPLIVRKCGPLEDAIDNAKRIEVWRWVSKNGFVAKMVKNIKIWKDIEGDEWKQV